MVAGEGIWLIDDKGRRYIDASSGPVASNLGHGHAGVVSAIHKQVDKLVFASSRVARTTENVSFADRLTAMAGPGFERAFLVSSGSEAIDAAIKFARVTAVKRGQTERTRLISLMPSYHGATLGSIAVSGDLNQASMFEGMVSLSEKLRAPLSYRRGDAPDAAERDEDAVFDELDQIIARIGSGSLLAMVVEPVGGLATGANVLSDRFLTGISQRVRAVGGMVIHDEVMSGGGRCGTFLTCHRPNVPNPDIAVLAKGLGAGYAPLAAMLVSKTLNDQVVAGGGFSFGHTYSANPISCAVGMAVLNALQDDNLMANAEQRGEQLRAGVARLAARHACIGDIRGRGLLLAVELVSDRATKATFGSKVSAPSLVRALGLEEGVTIYARSTNGGAFGEWFMLAPPLTITETEVEDLLERLDRTLDRFSTHLSQENPQ
ncbi:MAG: hypothetical protein ABS35_27090 [Kaistia sp. SCN 65-12]|nr:MAG: hypothetical protein ABS35_27090 [Kaistia sp. SCN 65-12]